MSDGTRIAVDVWLPADLGGRRIPTILWPTRYTRSSATKDQDDPGADANFAEANFFNGAGFAYVLADARGTGASFGSRRGELTTTEISDFAQIVDWIARQPFSNGNVGAMGISYPGVATELIGSMAPPGLRAVAPLYSYFDVYADLCLPGGIFARDFMDSWAAGVGAADRVPAIVHEQAAAGRMSYKRYVEKLEQPRPVDGPGGLALLAEAQAEHASNVSFPRTIDREKLLFRDDRKGDIGWAIMSPEAAADRLSRSRLPYHVQVSWLDAASAGGALRRFQRLDNEQELWIAPVDHGGESWCDPLTPTPKPARTLEERFGPALRFFARHLGEARPAAAPSRITYYTMGEGRWRDTPVWPPKGTHPHRLHLTPDGRLSSDEAREGTVRLNIKSDHATGEHSRWTTLYRGGAVRVDRTRQSEGLTRFKTEPLAVPLRLTGEPLLSLRLTSDQPDGTVFAYLEAVSPRGAVSYLTEGLIRLIHRRSERGSGGRLLRSFTRAAAAPVVPGQPFELLLPLQPLAALIPRGWRLQLSLADRDVGRFDRYDEGVPPRIRIDCAPSWLEIPKGEAS